MSNNAVKQNTLNNANKELQYKLYPPLSTNDDINQELGNFIRQINKRNSIIKRDSISQEEAIPVRRTTKLPTERGSLNFLKEIVEPDCKISKSEIISTVSRFLKNTRLIKRLSEDYQNDKKYSTSSLCVICAKRLSYEKFPENHILFKIGDVGDKFYFVLYGKLSVLKLKEIKDCYMTYREYFAYICFLKELNEDYIINEVLRKNYEIFQVSDYNEFLQVYNVYFAKALKSKLNENNFRGVEDLQDFFNKFHRTFEEFQIDENTLKNLWLRKSKQFPNSTNDWINYIITQTKPSIRDSMFFDQFQYLLTSYVKRSFTCIIYEHFLSFGSGDFFGDFALDSTERKRTATIRCESECILASLTDQEYLSMIAPKRKDDKQKDIAFLFNNFFFKEINIHIFEKNYFHLFIPQYMKMNHILYEEGTKPKELYLLNEGSLQLTIICSVIDLHNIIKFLYDKITKIKSYLDIPINPKKYLPKDKLIEIKKLTIDPELNSIVKQSQQFILDMFKVKTYDISIISGKVALGIEELFLDLPYLNTVKVYSSKATLYKLDKEKMEDMIKEEKACLSSLMKLCVQKVISLMERLTHIKRNAIQMALHNSKLDKQQEQNVNYGLIYKDTNVLKINQKVNRNRLKSSVSQNLKDKTTYNNSFVSRSVSEHRTNSQSNITKNKNKMTTRSMSSTEGEAKQKTIPSRTRITSIADYTNGILVKTNDNPLETKPNQVCTSLKKDINSENINNNNNDNQFLINFKDKYMTLSSFEKELHNYNQMKLFNLNPNNSMCSVLSISEYTRNSNDSDLIMTPGIKYKDNSFQNVLLQIGNTNNNNNNQTKSCRLNYIPLNLSKLQDNNNNIEENIKYEKKSNLENLLFLSQLKKNKKKITSSLSASNITKNIKVIDSKYFRNNKNKRKIQLNKSVILPNIVKNFYKQIQEKGYSGHAGEYHTYLKKKPPINQEKEIPQKNVSKLSGIFETEMNQLQERMMSKGTSFYQTNNKSSN